MTDNIVVSQVEKLEWAKRDFESALAAMPFGEERLAKGEQFNAYESAANDEDDDPDDWEFYLCLGPITDSVQIMGIQGEWRAKLIEAALRVALRSRLAASQSSAERIASLEAVAREAANVLRDALMPDGIYPDDAAPVLTKIDQLLSGETPCLK
jgi:hypothetical protein